MSNYHKGRRLEYELTNLFKKAGWSVIRGAGSKGRVGGFDTDIVVSKQGGKYNDKVYVVLLQAKRETRRVKNARLDGMEVGVNSGN